MLNRIRSLLRPRFTEVDDLITPNAETQTDLANVTPLNPTPLPPTVNSMGKKAEEAVESLSAEFNNWYQIDLNTLFDAWLRVQEQPQDDNAITALFRAAHNLSGTGQIYGKPEVARLCRSLAKLVSRRKSRADSALIGLHIDACRAATSGPKGTDVAKEVCAALENEVAKLRAA